MQLRLIVHSIVNDVAVALASSQRRKSRHDFQSLIPSPALSSTLVRRWLTLRRSVPAVPGNVGVP